MQKGFTNVDPFGARSRREDDVEVRIDDVLRASEAALDRIRVGEGFTAEAETLTWDETRGPNATPCFGRIMSGPFAGDLCVRQAGAGTDHPGVGRCSRHGGKTIEGRREAAWVIAHRFAQQLDVTPWQGLLIAVKIAAGKVAYIEAKLGEARHDWQFLPPEEHDRRLERARERQAAEDGTGASRPGPDAMTMTFEENVTPENLNWWVKQSEFWHDRLMRVSKLAIDAGVAERLVRQIELEAQLMLRATQMMLDELGLEGETREKALVSMSRNLLQLEAAETSDVSDRVGG